MRNLVSIGFFTQTEEGEYILRLDEYRITGGKLNVVDYRTLQTLIHNKSFDQRVEPLDAIRDLVFVQRRDELLTGSAITGSGLDRHQARSRHSNWQTPPQ